MTKKGVEMCLTPLPLWKTDTATSQARRQNMQIVSWFWDRT